jgi:antitoxin VapB
MSSETTPGARYAALFRNGRNQAVRIPKEFEMSGEQVRISREGNRLIMEPVGQAPKLLAVLASLEPLGEELPDIDASLLALDVPRLDERES